MIWLIKNLPPLNLSKIMQTLRRVFQNFQIARYSIKIKIRDQTESENLLNTSLPCLADPAPKFLPRPTLGQSLQKGSESSNLI